MSEKRPTISEVVAKAIYESHVFKKPWDHPDTIKIWHPIKKAEAKAAIAAYHKYVRAASGGHR